MILVSVDPGIRACGVAVFKDGVLLAAARVDSPLKKGNQSGECVAMALAVWEWVRGVLGLPASGLLPAVWHWLTATFPQATGWLESVLGVDVREVALPDVVALEWPRMYQGSKQRGDQNDLPALAGVDGALAALFPDAKVVTWYPDEWKGGQVPKEVMNQRVWERLSPEEQSRVVRLPKGGLDHNALDGVGIGLHYLGRLAKRRSYGC